MNATLIKVVEVVRDAKKRRDMSYKVICERAKAAGHNLSPGTLSRIESGEAGNCTLATLAAIAAGIGVSFEVFFPSRMEPADDSAQQRQARDICNRLPEHWAEAWLRVGEEFVELSRSVEACPRKKSKAKRT